MNHNAVDDALRTYRHLALAKALRICENAFDAEDAVQEASLKAWLKSQTLKQETKFRSWFLTIARNEALRVVRRRATVQASDFAEHPLPSPSNGVLDGPAAWDTFWKELRQAVSEREWKVLSDRFLHGIQLKEIAGDYSISVTTVKRAINRSKSKLAGLLNQVGK